MSIILSAPSSLEDEINKATELLSDSTSKLPDAVVLIIKFCLEKKLGFILSRNKQAGNCRDARTKRYRLGHIGIPLYDELKTCVLEALDQYERKVIFAVHCRAHKEFDFDEIAHILSYKRGSIKHLSEDLLTKHFRVEFGTVIVL